MFSYLIRRLLLVPVTFVGITFLVYAILRLSPGNPLEAELAHLRQSSAAAASTGGSAAGNESFVVDPMRAIEIAERYQMGKGIAEGYASWLGVWPSERERSTVKFAPAQASAQLLVPGVGELVQVQREGEQLAGRPQYARGLGELEERWSVRIESPRQLARIWQRVRGERGSEQSVQAATARLPYRAVLYEKRFDGLLQGNLGKSVVFNVPVWEMMESRFAISLYFGVISLLLTYAVCIPLGVLKALKHGSWFDSLSSAVVFAGYAIPGYALGALLLVWLGARLEWFPLMGFTSSNFDELGLLAKVADLLHHTALPLLCYVVGNFAMMTMLVKNSLLDQLGSDYMRTAIAKGVGFRNSVLRHGLRNSLIPVATTFGGVLSVLVSGSYLIEKIFDINGFGLMGFQAVLDRDYFVIMGSLAISSILVLLGNILSDVAVALVDPRVSYD